MVDQPKIDLAKLRSLILANAGPGKRFTRRGLSMAASEGRNPDLVRDIMRVDKRKPTLETAAGVCKALGIELSEIVKGVGPSQPENDWLEVSGAVAAGVWRENAEWPDDDRYEVEVGPPSTDGERYGLLVEGRSMDKTIPPGTVLECVKLIGSGLQAESGDYVIAERCRAGLYERTVKRLFLRPDGDYELQAESTLAEYKDAIPVGKPDSGAFGDDETRVIALVIKAHLMLHRTNRRAA